MIFEIAYVAPNAEAKPHEAADTQILSATTKPEIDMVQVDRGDNAYELSERISELDRSKALDVLDTHRPGDEIGPSDSGSKIVILDESNGVNSPTARLFSSDFAKARSQDNR